MTISLHPLITLPECIVKRFKMTYISQMTPLKSNAEEIANCVTHGVGFVLSIVGLAALVTLACMKGSASQIVSCAVFGSAMVLLYAASTIYHAFKNSAANRVLKTIDHSCIFLLIAGTYTPLVLVMPQGALGTALLATVWGIALFGILFKIFFVYRFKILSIIMYLSMGWLSILAIKPLMNSLPSGGVWWIAAGGLFYSSGVVFYAWKRLPFSHSIWHLFVLGGSACHYVAVLRYVVL
jgi:hemolysin III